MKIGLVTISSFHFTSLGVDFEEIINNMENFVKKIKRNKNVGLLCTS